MLLKIYWMKRLLKKNGKTGIGLGLENKDGLQFLHQYR